MVVKYQIFTLFKFSYIVFVYLFIHPTQPNIRIHLAKMTLRLRNDRGVFPSDKSQRLLPYKTNIFLFYPHSHRSSLFIFHWFIRLSDHRLLRTWSPSFDADTQSRSPHQHCHWFSSLSCFSDFFFFFSPF